MSAVTFAELDELSGEMLPERAVLSTITVPGGSFNQTGQTGSYSVGPNGVTYEFQSGSVSSQIGGNSGGLGGLVGGLLGGLGL